MLLVYNTFLVDISLQAGWDKRAQNFAVSASRLISPFPSLFKLGQPRRIPALTGVPDGWIWLNEISLSKGVKVLGAILIDHCWKHALRNSRASMLNSLSDDFMWWLSFVLWFYQLRLVVCPALSYVFLAFFRDLTWKIAPIHYGSNRILTLSVEDGHCMARALICKISRSLSWNRNSRLFVPKSALGSKLREYIISHLIKLQVVEAMIVLHLIN